MLRTVIEIAREAGDLALQRRSTLVCGTKPDGTWVTDADRALEELIRQRLADAFPGQPHYGEELGGIGDLTSGPCWVIDPIDGTTNFVNGLPTWGVSIGLLQDGVPALGVFHLPITRETFAARAGQGATLNGTAICPDQSAALGDNSLIALNSEAVTRLEVALPGKTRNFGTLAAHVCYAASGGVALSVGELWKPWDVAAALCIAFEAGAQAEDLAGNPLTTLAPYHPGDQPPTMLTGPPWALKAARNHITLRPLL